MAITRGQIDLSKVVWDASIYPRAKWSMSTIEEYADAMRGGDEFPALALEAGTDRLLDGKHRLEAHKKANGKGAIPAEWHEVPDGVPVKLYAASLSCRHGLRVTHGECEALACEIYEGNVEFSQDRVAKMLGVSQPTVNKWVRHIVERRREERRAKAWRLSQLGWTQREIAEALSVVLATTQSDVTDFIKVIKTVKADLAKGHKPETVAQRHALPDIIAWASVLNGLDDLKRLGELRVKIQPYDVWNFAKCHDLLGDRHPGRIPGELILHTLYFFTQQGDTVLDPMVGSGTTLDACLLMGRKCFSYDIDAHHGRSDVIHHNIAEDGWPDKIKKADLIFWDPPYFEKKDDGYVDGSVSGFGRDAYLKFFGKRLAEAYAQAKKGARLAFLMSDWDDDTGKRDGIFIWHYAQLIEKAGWRLERHIQAPLPTQQVHPDIVNKFRASRRLARLERYLLVGVK